MIDLKMMTAEQRRELKQKMRDLDQEAKRFKEEQKRTYDSLKDEVVSEVMGRLMSIEASLRGAKLMTFNDFACLLDLKGEMLNMTAEELDRQASHTFTTSDSKMSVIIGHNVIDGWDSEMVTKGTSMVNQWLNSKVTEDNKVFVSIIRDLMKPSKEGVLKASRVLELSKQAAKIGDVMLTEAIEMIVNAYQPTKTSSYVKARVKNDQGKDMWLQLAMSSVD